MAQPEVSAEAASTFRLLRESVRKTSGRLSVAAISHARCQGLRCVPAELPFMASISAFSADSLARSVRIQLPTAEAGSERPCLKMLLETDAVTRSLLQRSIYSNMHQWLFPRVRASDLPCKRYTACP